MGTRSKGRARTGQVTTYTYKPRLGRMSKLARRITRAVNRDTHARKLEKYFAAGKGRKDR